MQIADEVMKDLLTVYLSGEASEQTGRLVEAYLTERPDLRRVVETARNLKVAETTAPPPGLERRALDRTRRLLARKNLMLGLAIAFTCLPLSFVVDDRGLKFVLLRDAPLAACAALAAAAAFWAVFAVTCRRLAPTGLARRRFGRDRFPLS